MPSQLTADATTCLAGDMAQHGYSVGYTPEQSMRVTSAATTAASTVSAADASPAATPSPTALQPAGSLTSL